MNALAAVAPSSDPKFLALDRTCVRVAKTLEYTFKDEIMLLRMARMLKNVNRDLEYIVRRRASGGRSLRIVQAEMLLSTMESHLRSVLLENAALDTRQMREHLCRAVYGAFDLLELVGEE